MPDMRRMHLLIVVILLVGGCRFNVGVPTDQEVQQMQAWAEVVTPKDRADVVREANQHTEWAERRKVQWITGEYKKRFEHLQSKIAAKPTTATTTTAPSATDNGGL